MVQSLLSQGKREIRAATVSRQRISQVVGRRRVVGLDVESLTILFSCFLAVAAGFLKCFQLQVGPEKKWSTRKDLRALRLPKGTFDLLVPNQMPALVELYGFLLK